jgi:hypothetical protein
LYIQDAIYYFEQGKGIRNERLFVREHFRREVTVKTLSKIVAGIFLFSAISIAAQGHDSVSVLNTTTIKKTTCNRAAVKSVSPDTVKQKAKIPVVSPDTLIVIARLVEIPGKFPPNDLYNYVYIMKYRIIKVLKGGYAAQEILVGHYNPLIPRPQIKDKMAPLVRGKVTRFETGAKHKLTLVTPIERVWKDAVEDDYADSDLDKYFALKADVAQ